jgi:general secretion pathway protein I
MRRATDESGFTLIEVVVAFTIAALCLGAVFQLLTGSLAGLRGSAAYTHATQLAESRLERVGIVEPLVSGVTSGRFDEQFAWQMQTDPLPGTKLYRVRLTVSWHNRSVLLESLRLQAGAG